MTHAKNHTPRKKRRSKGEAVIGFFHVGKKAQPTRVEGFTIEMLHKAGCLACPLKKDHGSLRNPDMQPYGSDEPLIYMLGESPTEQEDARGKPFESKYGRKIRNFMPEEILQYVRWNNVVRTKTPKDRSPTNVEMECCRQSIISDIEQTKPKAIFGFGVAVLKWAINESSTIDWRGRRIPVQIGNHKCWFFSMLHPKFLELKEQKWSRGPYTSEFEFAFARDIENAIEILDDLPEPIIDTRDDVFANIEYVTGANGWDDVETVRAILSEMATSKYVGFDYETNRLRPYHEDAKILTAAVSNGSTHFGFAIDHPQATWTEEQRDEIHNIMLEFLESDFCTKICHHLAFEMEWTAFHFGEGTLRAGKWGDPECQAYVMHGPGELSLNSLVLNHFGVHLKALSNVDTQNLESTPIETVLRYNVPDAKYHRKLFLRQNAQLKEMTLTQTYEEQIRRVPTVVLTQLKGVPVNPETVARFDVKYRMMLEKIEAKIAADKDVLRFERITKNKFKPGSPHDVRKLILKVLKAETEKADEKALKKISAPIAKLVLKWRSANKMHSTYIKPLMPNSPHLYAGNLLHPVIGITTVRTWRTSSEEPNEQNFPKHKGREIRSQIAARLGEKLLAFDYAGIQARNIAMESRDKNLVKAFKDRYDVHSDWMKEIQSIYPKWADKDRMETDKDYRKDCRQKAKNQFVFATFFGAHAASISKAMGVPQQVIEEAHKRFWVRFPNIKRWQEGLEVNYRENGYVTGLSGFRRYAPVTHNEIINTPIQSDEAIIVLGAMNRLSEMEEDRFQANLEIHDDLSFFWNVKEIDKNIEVVVKEMTRISYDWINVPLTVEVSIGDDWSNLTEIGVYSSDSGWEKKDDWRKI